MKAAIVTDFNEAPTYQEMALPAPAENETTIKVLAASVNQLVRAQANGTHYSSNHQLPMVPGVDGVGETANGQQVYFLARHTNLGALATQTVTDQRMLMPLTGQVDPAVIAATVNPALSSFMAIKLRLGLDSLAGKRVMIIGATGNAGQLAVTLSRELGAEQIIAVGRNADVLASLKKRGATQLIQLGNHDIEQQLAQISDVDIVLDYLWGDVATQFMLGILKLRENRHQLLQWVQIGSLAGADINLPAAALRSTNLQLLGSGIGSLAPKKMLQAIPELMQLIETGVLRVSVTKYPLSTVHENWPTQTTQRIVFIP